MEVGFLSVLAMGFALGIKHAIEPDHVIAVSTLASQSKKLYRSTLAGVFWGIGHTATLFIIGIIIILMKGEIPETLALSLEFLVGIMLVYLGVNAAFSLKKPPHHYADSPSHNKPAIAMSYIKSMLIGFVHGLAGSGAMVLLTMSTVKSTWEATLFMLIFGAGTVIGMLFFTTIIGLPFVMTTKKINLNTILTKITASISIVFGLYYMYRLGINEGLFRLWLA